MHNVKLHYAKMVFVRSLCGDKAQIWGELHPGARGYLSIFSTGLDVLLIM